MDKCNSKNLATSPIVATTGHNKVGATNKTVAATDRNRVEETNQTAAEETGSRGKIKAGKINSDLIKTPIITAGIKNNEALK